MEKKQLFVVFNHEGEIYQHETLEEALKEFEAEKDDYEFFTGDEQVYLAKVIKMAYVVEDHEIAKVEDPTKYGFEYWVKWQEQHFDEFGLLQQLQQAQEEIERLEKRYEFASQVEYELRQEIQQLRRRLQQAMESISETLDLLKRGGPGTRSQVQALLETVLEETK